MKQDMLNYNDMMECYPILYGDRNKSMMETCMCRGIEAGFGWFDPINKLSFKLEEMNKKYIKEYGVFIRADQVKEKLGTLRFYFSVVDKCPTILSVISYPFNLIHNTIKNHVRFKSKYIIDQEEYTTEEWKVITKEEYDAKKFPEWISNDYGWRFKEDNGLYYRNSCLHHGQRGHYELQNHKILHWIMKKSKSVACTIESWYTPHKNRDYVVNAIYDTVTKMVSETEHECYDYCETCGSHMGEHSYNPRCRTVGWISYICESCAKKSEDREYVKNGALYKNGIMIKSKEDLEYKNKESEDETSESGCIS